MVYLIICFACIAVLLCIAVLYNTGHMPFNHKPLAFVIGIAAFASFYMASDNGEIHILSERIAKVIVSIVQFITHLVR